MAKTLPSARRTDAFWIWPEKTMVDPVFDSRASEAPDRALIESIKAAGVVQPPLTYKQGGEVFIAIGRRRRAAAIIANEELVKAGLQPREMYVRDVTGSEQQLRLLNLASNSCTKPPSPMWWAEQASAVYAANGNQLEPIAASSGVTVNTVRTWLKVFEAIPLVRKAVDAGKLPFSAAADLARLPREEQTRLLGEAIEKNASGRDVQEAARASRKSSEERAEVKPKRRTKVAPSPRLSRRIALVWKEKVDRKDGAFFEEAPELAGAVAYAQWATGDISEKEACKRVPGLADIIAMAGQDRRKEAKKKLAVSPKATRAAGKAEGVAEVTA